MTQEIVINSNQAALSTTTADAWSRAAHTWLHNFDSKRTRDLYERAWRRYMSYVQEHETPLSPLSDQQTVVDFRNFLEEKIGLSPSTINIHLSALSSFFNFAVERGLVDKNPVDGVKRKSVEKYGKATALNPHESEHKAFLAQIDRDTEQGKRDYAMMLVFLTTAVRRSVITQLRVGDIEKAGSKWYMEYTTKGGATKRTMLPEIVVEAISQYLATRSDLTEESFVFVATERGRKAAQNSKHVDAYKEKALSTRTINNLVNKYAKMAGFENITPHSLRHTAAINAEKAGMTVSQISSLLGHSNTGVTTIYLHHVSDSGADVAVEALAADLGGV